MIFCIFQNERLAIVVSTSHCGGHCATVVAMVVPKSWSMFYIFIYD